MRRGCFSFIRLTSFSLIVSFLAVYFLFLSAGRPLQTSSESSTNSLNPEHFSQTILIVIVSICASLTVLVIVAAVYFVKKKLKSKSWSLPQLLEDPQTHPQPDLQPHPQSHQQSHPQPPVTVAATMRDALSQLDDETVRMTHHLFN